MDDIFYADPFFIFQNSMHDNLNISDVIIRILAIENFYKKNNFGFEIYNLMQKTRVKFNPNIPKYRADNQDQFINLIKSFEKKGYDEKFPIQLNKDLELLDGSHRLSLSVFHKLNSIPYYIPNDKRNVKVDYSIEWFSSHSLSKLVPIIRTKYIQIIKDYKT